MVKALTGILYFDKIKRQNDFFLFDHVSAKLNIRYATKQEQMPF